MSRKKILISARCMEVGGIERSLLGILGTIDYERHQVDLFLWSHTGPLLEMIPPQVNLLREIKEYALMDKPIAKMLFRGCLLIGAIRLTLKIYVALRIFLGHRIQDTLAWYYHEYSLPLLPPISNEQYDLAISFQGPTTFLDKVKARRKIGWVHTDYSLLNIDTKFMERVWRRADIIAAVSESCRNVFAGVFPALADRLVIIENVLSPETIRRQAQVDVASEIPPQSDVTNICTVGRYSHPKAFDRAVAICKKLVALGCPIRWYAVGPSSDHPELSRYIRAAGMENYFIPLGEKTNPYPYIAACDIYVQPSRYEGKAVSVREAQILGKPVVITNFSTSSSQLRDGYDGIIVPMDIAACANGIRKIIQNMEMRQLLSRNALSTDYSNKDEIMKIVDLIPAT